MSYLRPVNPTGICTYNTHTRRTIPSKEAGVDYYCPIGTPIRAAGDGVIYERGGSILAATGRYITLDLNDGRRVRYLHLSRYASATWGTRVRRGDVIGYSGASGYGSEFFGASSPATIPSNTGGPHVHTTLWAGHYYKFGQYPYEPTLDFERYVDLSATSSVDSSPFETANPTVVEEEEDMFTIYRRGGAIRVVGNDRDFRIGGALTGVTGVDGAEALLWLAKGAKVVDLDDRGWDVINVILDATAGKPVQSLDDTVIAKIVAALAAKIPASAGATAEDVRQAVADAFDGLVLRAERPAS